MIKSDSISKHRLDIRRLLRPTIILVAVGAIIYLIAMFGIGWNAISAAISKIGIGFVLLGIGMTTVSFLFRFLKWNICLRSFAYRVPLGINFRVYISGLALTASPGKLGETVRAMLLLPFGVKPSHSISASFADRSSDVLGVCLLGFVSELLIGGNPYVLATIFSVLIIASFLLAWAIKRQYAHSIGRCLLNKLPRLPIKRFAPLLVSWMELWKPLRLTMLCLLTIISYGIQALVFFLFCHISGLQVGLFTTVSIYVNATLLGAASMIPSGLGAMEASIVYQLVGLGVDQVAAISVTVTVRLVTLWYAISFGIFALISIVKAVNNQQLEKVVQNC